MKFKTLYETVTLSDEFDTVINNTTFLNENYIGQDIDKFISDNLDKIELPSIKSILKGFVDILKREKDGIKYVVKLFTNAGFSALKKVLIDNDINSKDDWDTHLKTMAVRNEPLFKQWRDELASKYPNLYN